LVCILEINIEDSKEIYKSGKGGNYIGILPPSTENLRERIKLKLIASTEEVNKVLLDAQDEIKEIENYKDNVNNNDKKTVDFNQNVANNNLVTDDIYNDLSDQMDCTEPDINRKLLLDDGKFFNKTIFFIN